MKFNRNLTAILLSSCGLLATSVSCLADVETTTVKTTTISSDGTSNTTVEKQSTTTTDALQAAVEKTIVLPSSSTYVLVDPITGRIQGSYDPTLAVVDTNTITPGLIVIDQTSGRLVATVAPSGHTVDIISTPAMLNLLNAIDTRQAELDQMLTSGLNKGAIEPAQAAAFRSELDKIMLPKVIAKQNGRLLTYSEALSTALALNNLADRLALLTNTPVMVPLIGSRIVSSNGQIIMVDEITSRRLRLGQRVDDEYAAGRLSNQQVSRLKDQLNVAASLDSKYRKNGELSESKAVKVSAKLDKVNSDINKDVAIINEKRSKIGIRVQ